MTSRTKKFLYPLLVIVVGLALISWMTATSKSSIVPAEVAAVDPLLNAPTVKTTKITRSNLAPQVVLYSQFKSAQQIAIKAPISTDVLAINVQEGDRVAKGDRLAELDTLALQRQLTQLSARKQEIEARFALEQKAHAANEIALPIEQNLVDIAQRSVDRLIGLENKNLASNADIENAERTLANQRLAFQNRQLAISRFEAIASQYQAQLIDIENQISQAKTNIESAFVYAPFDGIISELQVQVSDSISAGKTLMTLANEQQQQLEAWISVDALPSFNSASDLTAYIDTNSDQVEATLVSIDPVSQAGSVRLRFQLKDKTTALTLNRFYRLWLNLPAVSTFAVPQASVYSNGYVYSVEQNQLQRIGVTVIGERMIDGALWRLIEGDLSGKKVLVTRLQDAAHGLTVNLAQSVK